MNTNRMVIMSNTVTYESRDRASEAYGFPPGTNEILKALLSGTHTLIPTELIRDADSNPGCVELAPFVAVADKLAAQSKEKTS